MSIPVPVMKNGQIEMVPTLVYHPGLEKGGPLRNGNIFYGIDFNGQSFMIGDNSHANRASIQNGFHEWMRDKGWLGGVSPYFMRMGNKQQLYTRHGTSNPYSIYGQ
jgi:hypothetical protein